MAKQQLANAYVPHPMEMRIRLWMPDNRPRDIDNYAKLPKDVCCEVLGRNDTWFNIPRLVIECLGVKPNGRCEVCFLALEGDVRFAQARGD